MEELMRKMSKEETIEIINKRKLEDGNLYKYLILIEGEYVSNECENYKSFEIITGRQATYDFIKNILENQKRDEYCCEFIMDVSKSKIISEPPVITDKTPRITLSNMLSVYLFMKIMKEKGKIIDDTSFDIEDYYDGYLEEE